MQGIVGICHECGQDGKKDRKIVEKGSPRHRYARRPSLRVPRKEGVDLKILLLKPLK